MDDAVLLERARQGDETALSTLYARHQRAIYRYATCMCGPDAGDDLVQETFLAVLRQSGRRDAPGGPVIGYLLGIARHFAMKRLTARQKEAPADEIVSSDIAATDGSALDDLTRFETIEAVRAAVRALPPAYREVVVLCELQELDYAAASVIIACPIGTVRSRLHRARAMLATRLAAIPQATGVTGS